MKWLFRPSLLRALFAAVIFLIALGRIATQVFHPASGTIDMCRVFFVQDSGSIKVATSPSERAKDRSLSDAAALTQLEQRAVASVILMQRRPHRARGVFIGWHRRYFNPLNRLAIGSSFPFSGFAGWEAAYAADADRFDAFSDALISALEAEARGLSDPADPTLLRFARNGAYAEVLRTRAESIREVDQLARAADFACIAVAVWASMYLVVAVRAFPRRATQSARARRGECPSCGYSLEGLGASERCPECGEPAPVPG